jgi:hypothetical protein
VKQRERVVADCGEASRTRSENFPKNLKKLLIPGTAVLYFAKVFLFPAAIGAKKRSRHDRGNEVRSA